MRKVIAPVLLCLAACGGSFGPDEVNIRTDTVCLPYVAADAAPDSFSYPATDGGGKLCWSQARGEVIDWCCVYRRE